MSRAVVIGLRVLQIVAAVVNLVLVGLGKIHPDARARSSQVKLTNAPPVVNWYLARTDHSPPSSFNFLLFAPSFSIVCVAYLELAPRHAAWATHPFLSLAVEATNTVFYFGGFIAVAILLSRLVFCEGTVCAVARATSVLAAAEFGAWIVTTMMQAKDIFKNGVRSYKPEPGSLAAAERAAAGSERPAMAETTEPARGRERLSIRQIYSGFDFGLRSPRSPR